MFEGGSVTPRLNYDDLQSFTIVQVRSGCLTLFPSAVRQVSYSLRGGPIPRAVYTL